MINTQRIHTQKQSHFKKKLNQQIEQTIFQEVKMGNK